jgi:ADP-ribosylglycohydrolase
VARRLVDWTATQKGLGSHTRAVLAEPDFLADPATAALRVWELGDRQAAPNGAVMRSAVVGLFSPDFDEVWGMAMAYSRITHADPRCQISSAMVAGLVCLLRQGARIDVAIEMVHEKQERDPLKCGEVSEEFIIWDGLAQGYTFKPVQAAIRALRLLDELRPGQDDMLTVVPLLLARQIREGGDTDTNAAVAGAVLGAYTGASAFLLLRGGLLRLDAVRERAARLTGSEE